ncbi:hypothetical protein BJ138DRAFT_446216 [Hygrophoropsis aurantiaca]|uniref:Uncharacterized protein n=1 Tax=Hygrophoropsis aurantiaca TaxID=72124 RepID=A0ACB8A347_9AGAM|nr:hypothetical protein BJ138DRAFT_446216 [Hygrophoropsis aurantiaca]
MTLHDGPLDPIPAPPEHPKNASPLLRKSIQKRVLFQIHSSIVAAFIGGQPFCKYSKFKFINIVVVIRLSVRGSSLGIVRPAARVSCLSATTHSSPSISPITVDSRSLQENRHSKDPKKIASAHVHIQTRIMDRSLQNVVTSESMDHISLSQMTIFLGSTFMRALDNTFDLANASSYLAREGPTRSSWPCARVPNTVHQQQ